MVSPKISGQIQKQLKHLAGGIFETAKKTSGEMAGKVLEQVGIPTGQGSEAQSKQTPSFAAEKNKITQMEATDKMKTAQQMKRLQQELAAEVEKWQKLREEQLRRRREEEPKPPPPQEEETPQPPGKKPKRGSIFMKRQKGKTEMSAFKRSG